MTKLRVGLLTSAFLIIGLSVPVSAEDAQSAQNPPITVEEEARTQEGHVSGDFVYSIKEDGTARIFQCSKKEGEVVIPETIDGYTVTELGNSVFYQAAELTSVTLTEYAANNWRNGIYGVWCDFYKCARFCYVNRKDGFLPMRKSERVAVIRWNHRNPRASLYKL